VTIQEKAATELRDVAQALLSLPAARGTIADISQVSGLSRSLVVRRLRPHPSPFVPRYFTAIERPRARGRSLTVWALTPAGRELAEATT
jgi:hypothetical protein